MDAIEFKKKNDLSILLTKIRILSMMTFKFFCDHPEIEDKIVIETLSTAYLGINHLIEDLLQNSKKFIKIDHDEWSPQEVAFYESINASNVETDIDPLYASTAHEDNNRNNNRVDNDHFEYKTTLDPDHVYDLTEMHKLALADPPKDGKKWRQLPKVISSVH